MNGDARGLKLRLVLLTLALYVPLILLFTFATNAHDYFLRLQALGATPTLTSQFTIPVMGGDPHGPGGFDRGHSPPFFAFWGLLFAGPALVSVWVSRARDRATPSSRRSRASSATASSRQASCSFSWWARLCRSCEVPCSEEPCYGFPVTELLTPRLLLRPFHPDDFEAHARICGDAEVMKYIRAGALSREDSWWQLARYLGHWQLRGYGCWAVVERSSSALIGHLGFFHAEGGHGLEFGWALAREAWGRGYALEGTLAAKEHGFEALGFTKLLCVIRPDNERSLRLAERLGAEADGETLGAKGERLLVRSLRPSRTA